MILVVDMNCKKNSLGYFEFVLPIVSLAVEFGDCVVKHYTEVNEENASGCDCAILSGTPLRDNATLSQLEKFQWVKTYGKPILGICAGMQTIGLVFGSRLNRCLGIGMTEIFTLTDNPLFPSKFKAYALHNFSVEPSVEFEVLAKSTQCIEAIRHKERPVYGVLFHPEVRSPEILQRLFLTFGLHRRV